MQRLKIDANSVLLPLITYAATTRNIECGRDCTQVAAGYLAWCPSHGAAAMTSLLEGLPLEQLSGSAVLRAMALCDQHDLGGVKAGATGLDRGNISLSFMG